VRTWLLRTLGVRGVALVHGDLVQPGAQHAHRGLLVLQLDFSFWQETTRPVGRWVIRTAESVVLTLWPPGPLER
jgi:hypothetical protein